MKINIIHKLCKFMVPWFYFIFRPISWILLLGHLLDCEGLVALWYDHYCPGHNWKLFVDGENLWIGSKWRKNLLHKKVPTSLPDSNDERIHWQNSWCPIFENPIANFGEGNGILGSSEICRNNQGSPAYIYNNITIPSLYSCWYKVLRYVNSRFFLQCQ